MSSETNNYKLIKPDGDDFYNVEDFNSNADIIDSELKKNSDSLNNLKDVAKTGNASETTVSFTETGTRTNLTSGEKLSISLGKIKKWFSDLKTVAFSGSYNDLTNKPASLPANGGNADTVDGKHASDLQNYNNLTNKPVSMPANGGNADTVDGKHASDLQNYNNLTNKPVRMPANGGNADTVDGKHASDLTEFKAFSNSDTVFKSHYIGCFSVDSEGIEGVSFKGESYKDSAPDRDFYVERYSRFYTDGKQWFFRLDQYNDYNENWYSPTIEKLNGNADTVDGKHASNFVTDSPTGADSYTTVLAWALAQNQSAIAYSSADSSLSNAEDKPSNGQYGQFHYLLLKGQNTRKTVLAIEYGLTGKSIYKRSIINNSWFDSWAKINDGGNADTVDGYHAYQFQNLGSGGTPEATYLKSEYDNSKGRFYLKAYNDSGEHINGVYVDYSANSDRLQDRQASDFYSIYTASIDKTTDPVTWNNGIYTVEGQVKESDGYPFDSGWVHATIYVSGQRNTNQDTGERLGYGVVRYVDQDNKEFIKTQLWGESQWTKWTRIITDDVLAYKEIEPDYIGGGYTVMLEE